MNFMAAAFFGISAVAALVAALGWRVNSLQQEIRTMGFTDAQQQQIEDALAANNKKILDIVLAAVTAEAAELKAEIQKIEVKVTEGAVTPADMAGLLAKISASPDNIKAAVETAIGGISKDSGADDAAAEQVQGGEPQSGV